MLPVHLLLIQHGQRGSDSELAVPARLLCLLPRLRPGEGVIEHGSRELKSRLDNVGHQSEKGELTNHPLFLKLVWVRIS